MGEEGEKRYMSSSLDYSQYFCAVILSTVTLKWEQNRPV